LRGSYYGDYKQFDGRGGPLTVQNFDALTQFDFDVTWDLTDRYRVTIGGNNVFDELPEPGQFESCCGRIIRSNSVMDWQGPLYYVRGSIMW